MSKKLLIASIGLIGLLIAQNAFAAIAYDNSAVVSNYAASGQATTNYTMGSAANGVIFVWNESGGGTDPTKVTFNGSALTKIVTGGGGGAFTISLWCLAAPTSGLHAVVVSSTAQIYYSVISYTGVNGCTLDASTTSNGTAIVGANTITPANANTWMMSYVENEGTASFTATSTGNTSVLRGASGQFGDMSMIDSSGTITQSSPYRQGAVFAGSSAYGIESVTLIPFAASNPTSSPDVTSTILTVSGAFNVSGALTVN